MKYALLLISLLLAGCASTPDEAYELPSPNFPRLIDVPDRPVIPEKSELEKSQKNLIETRDAAIKKQAELWPSLPPTPAKP